jgi:anti-sigma regulatory factor (Ser/Thr protein kinase)
MTQDVPRKRNPARGGHAGGWSRVIPNDLSAVDGALRSFESFLDSRCVEGTPRFHALLVLEEAVTNVIKYAFTDKGDHEVHAEARLDEGEIVLRVSDAGRAFDPLAAPPPDFDRPLEERPIGGLGIHLLRELTDRAAYERVGGRNQLTLVFLVNPGT